MTDKKPSSGNASGPASGGGGSALHELLVHWRWPLVVVALAVIALLAYRFTVQTAREAVEGSGEAVSEVVRGAGRTAVDLAEAFRQGSIETTFRAAIPEVATAGTGRLELATSEVVETFEASDELTVAWGMVSLGETESEIRVPVTYRYHLRLDDPWRLEIEGQTCIVHAPKIRPSLPAAIHTDRLERRSRRGWGRMNSGDQMEALERSITPTLSLYARDAKHLSLVREQARTAVARFVRAWLLQEDHWREDRFRAIIVRFPDEAEEEPTLARPVLRLEDEPVLRVDDD